MQKGELLTETRFREGSGERYMKNGRVRCQSLSGHRVRMLREEYGMPDADRSEFWPEAQCHMVAEDGTYTCKYHSGRPRKRESSPRNYLDTFPSDLTEKLRKLQEAPDYISRMDDINLMRARIMQLGERLMDDEASEEAWAEVAEALVLLRQGNFLDSAEMLEKALDFHDTEKHTWKEIRETEGVLKDLTNTQVKVAKEMRLMATYEQVQRLMANIFEVITTGATEYIDSDRERAKFSNFIAGKFSELVGVGPLGVVQQAILLDGERD